MTRLSFALPVFSIALATASCHRRPTYTKPPTAVRVEPVVATTQGATSRIGATILAQTQVDLAFKMVDFFRHRLMIPIARESGAVVAFGGRALDQGPLRLLQE
jgi:hypothetical protein